MNMEDRKRVFQLKNFVSHIPYGPIEKEGLELDELFPFLLLVWDW
jgi:hypothetical protein